MVFTSLDICARGTIEKYTVPYNYTICDFSFLTLFLCRERNDVSYTIIDDTLVIREKLFDGKYHFLRPLGYDKENLPGIVDKLSEYREKNGMEYLFRCADTAFISDLKAVCPSRFQIVEDRDSFDYIYKADKFIALSGKALHHKKNNYNHFLQNNSFYKGEVTSENLNECARLAQRWVSDGVCDDNIFYEIRFLKEIIRHKDKLRFKTMAVYANGVLSGFTVGERINDNMAVIHIERADHSIRGIYQYINREFIADYFSDVKYVNREEDAGIEALRRSKMSYRPEWLEVKYDVF